MPIKWRRLRSSIFSIFLFLGLASRVEAQQTITFDIDRLAHAIAVAETGDCTAGVGLSKHNCHSINSRKGYLTFESRDAEYVYWKAMWLRVYGDHFPSWQEAKKYTANPDPYRWYCVVKIKYGLLCSAKTIARLRPA